MHLTRVSRTSTQKERERERGGYLIKLNLHTRGTLASVPQASSFGTRSTTVRDNFQSRDFNLCSATVTNITRYSRRMFSPQLVKSPRRFVISIFVNELPSGHNYIYPREDDGS